MEFKQFINNIYKERFNIFTEIINNKEDSIFINKKHFNYINQTVLNIIKKNYAETLPVQIPDEDLVKLSNRISKYFSQYKLSFLAAYKVTEKLIKFLNSKLAKKYRSAHLTTKVINPTINSNFLSSIEELSLQNLIEDYQPGKIFYLRDILQLREFFNKNFPLKITKENQKIDSLNLQHSILFSIIVNSFVNFNDIVYKFNNLSLADINLELGFLNFKNKNNQNIRFFIDFFSLFLIKTFILNLNLHKIPLTKRNSKMIFSNISNESFNEWIEILCKKSDIDSKITINLLLDLSNTLASFIFPPTIVALLKRKLEYTSFDFKIIDRLSKNKYGKIDWNKFKFPKAKTKKIKKSSKKLGDIKEEIKILYRIYTILNTNKIYSKNFKNILKYLKKVNLEKYSLSFNLLIEWLLFNLSKKSKRLKISTIKEYFSGFYKDFLEITYEFSIFELDEDEIEEIVQQLFLKRFFKINYNNKTDYTTDEDINFNKFSKEQKKSVGKITAKIKNFFNFYKTVYNKNLSDNIFYPLEKYRGISSVRTSLITPGEFELFLKIFNTHHRKDFIEIIAGLGFFCGLRKSEILNLTFKDIVFGVEDYIYISKSKTNAGRRKVPISYLAPVHFLKKFKKFYEQNLNLNKNKMSAKLFNNKLYKKEDFTKDVYCIIFGLKKFFNDEKLVFHSLRHCFGSWMIINFFSITRPKFEEYLSKLFKNNKLLGLKIYNKEKLKIFFKSDDKRLSAFGLWRISMVIGHISPEESLSNYIHVLELFTGYFYWIISLKHKNLYKFYGKFDAKRIIKLISKLKSDRSVRKAGFLRIDNSYSILDIMKYLDKKLKLNSIF